MRKGITLLEGLMASGAVLVLCVPMLLGVLDMRRRADDAQVVSAVRQAQAAIETYRAKRGSYPAAALDLVADSALAEAFGYRSSPEGCGAGKAETCRSYEMRFALRGSFGGLVGGNCLAQPQGLSCSR